MEGGGMDGWRVVHKGRDGWRAVHRGRDRGLLRNLAWKRSSDDRFRPVLEHYLLCK